jgi:hypothetical protein
MNPGSIVAVLFWGTVAAATLSVARDSLLRRLLSRYWKRFFIFLILAVLWRVPFKSSFFHGLEYEDSYVYTVAGRQMSERAGPPFVLADSPYSINACVVGSLLSCQEWESFPEHLIGYPYAISICSRMFGYTPSIGSFINLAASCITVLFVFFVTFEVSENATAASLASLAFALIPAFAVYGLETSAEPFSNTVIILVCWLYLRIVDTNESGLNGFVLTWVAYSAALLFGQTIKRENFLLAVIMPAMLPFVLKRDTPRLRRYAVVGLVLLTSGISVFFSFKMHLIQTSSGEIALLRQFPMTGQKLLSFVLGFLKSFVVFKWYAGTAIFVVIGIYAALLRQRRALLPSALLIVFVLVYAFHIRSYYEMESGYAEPQRALRFSMNFMAVWAIAAGLGAGWIWPSIKRRLRNRGGRYSRLCLWAGTPAVLMVSFVLTSKLRSIEVEDESISRVNPALTAAHYASKDTHQPVFIIGMEPLVIQMYGSPSVRIVDLESISAGDLQVLISSHTHLVFLEQSDRYSAEDLARYGEPIREVLSMPSIVLASGYGFNVLKLVTDAAKHLEQVGISTRPGMQSDLIAQGTYRSTTQPC